ncbi:MAG: PQQ-binding-like beta-propeller repeat protein, partial [Mucilaginibacter sp.]
GQPSTYTILVGKDTFSRDQSDTSYAIFGISGSIISGQVIAKNSKGDTTKETFTVGPFDSQYLAYDYSTERFYSYDISTNPHPEWIFGAINQNSVYNMGFDFPAMSGDTLFTGEENALRATNIKTGEQLWNLDLDGSPYMSLLFNNGTIYTSLSSPQEVIAVDAKTHVLKWSYEPDPTYLNYTISDPVITNNTIYFGFNFSLYAVDAATGAKKWHFDTNGATGGCATDGANVYLSSQDGYLYAVDANSGQLKWKYKFSSFFNFERITTVHNGLVIQCLDDRTIFVDAGSGQLVWQTGPSATPAFSGDTVFMGANGNMNAFNIKSGAQIWKTADPYFVGYDIIKAGNVIYDGRGASAFNRFSAKDGKALYASSGANGMVQGGLIPVMLINGQLYFGNSSSIARSGK